MLKKQIGAVVLAAALLGTSNPGFVHAAEKKAESMKVTGAKTLYIGSTAKKKVTTLKVTVTPKKASQKVTFKSSNTKVAKVSAKGKVTAVKAGKAVITVTSKSNKKLKKKVTITVKNYSEKSVLLTMDGTSETVQKKLTMNPDPTAKGAVTYTSSREEIAEVDENGVVTAKKLGKAVITATASNGKTAECTVTVQRSSMSIHDPSVYRDPVSGNFYSFGSHLTAAVSKNLIGWSFTSNATPNYNSSSTLFTKKYTEEFAEPYAFTMPDGAKENAWAPDIIYNTSMKKYCMYVSIVDGSKKCCIAMAVSDNADGPYSYQGMIVCSGLAEDGSDVDKTNVASALGISEDEAEESKYATLGDNSPDCIDATVFYDHEGNLWMVYGSFTTGGGIRLLKLDPDTGLRGENYKDSGDGSETTLGTDDPYYGKKIANCNGEGPYIQMVKNENSSTGYYYYLWTSTGNLNYYGGYNMRMVRAENPEGPYYDTKGNEATQDLQKYAMGLRVMDNYKFSFMDYAFVSCGGNSAAEDESGKTFIQFHQRTSNSDSYNFRTHQTFENEDGWLVTAPFEYNGETIEDSYDKEDVVGDYEFIYHRDYFAKTTTKNMDYVSSERLTLNADGTVSGAYEGTWTLNGHYVTIHINGEDYKGVVLEQYEQTEEREKVMVFTAIGSDNRTIWGSKMHKTNVEAVEYDAEQISVPETVDADVTLPDEGLFGSEITWTSDNNAVSIQGTQAKLKQASADVAVNLTAVVSRGEISVTKKFTVTVKASSLKLDGAVNSGNIELPQALADGTAVSWSSSDTGVISNDGKVVQPEEGYQVVTMTASAAGKETQEFPVVVLPKAKETLVYDEDYSGMVSDGAIATVWYSKDKQNCFYVESDEEKDSFIKFAAGNTSSSQGAESDFGVSDKAGKKYTVEFDVALEAGTGDTTEFAVTGTDAAFQNDDTNAGLESGYVFKLSSQGETWSVNDGAESFELPAGWVHVTVSVDAEKKKAAVMISDDKKVYYGGEVSVSGSGELKGLYLRWGAKQALVSVDNVKVY